MPSVSIFSPAKINLFLAITGRRADGYHDLVSLVAPLDWGDTLTAESAPAWTLTCTDPAVPLDDSNLVLRAAVDPIHYIEAVGALHFEFFEYCAHHTLQGSHFWIEREPARPRRKAFLPSNRH